MKRHKTWKGTEPSEPLCYSPWRATYALWYTITHSSPWRALLLAVASIHCSLLGSAIFNPKNPIFINLNPKLIGNSTYDHSTTWTTVIYEFYGLSTTFTTNSTCSIIKSDFKPYFSISHEQQQNYMLNSVLESHSLKLENISPTLTLD